jgi:hypothetical protein
MLFILHLSYLSFLFAQISVEPGLSPNSNYMYQLFLLPTSLINSSKMHGSVLMNSPLSIAKSMRNSNETLTIVKQHPYTAGNKEYIFSQNKTEISSPENNSHTADFGKGTRIAVDMPTFTAAAYHNSFYLFYQKYINTKQDINITTDLNLLTSRVTMNPNQLHQDLQCYILLGTLSG